VDKFIEVRVQVPQARLGEFYELVGRFHQVSALSTEEPPEVPKKSQDALRSWTEEPEPFHLNYRAMILPHRDPEEAEPIGEYRYEKRQPDGSYLPVDGPGPEVRSPEDDAQDLYMRLSPPALEVLDYLVEHAGQFISGVKLAQEMGVSQAQLTGSLSSLRLRTKALSREIPLHYEPGPDGGTYTVDINVANVFREATHPRDWGGYDLGDATEEAIANTLALLDLFPQRRAARAILQELRERAADETSWQDAQREVEALDRRILQLSKTRAWLVRKYKALPTEEFSFWESTREVTSWSAAPEEVQMRKSE
jgi:hypothetical protein